MVYIQENNFRTPALLTADEVDAYETRHPEGLTSAEIVKAFSARGIRFSEATLRKYVQQGLLPRSKRVGQKGKHRGSRGVYPSTTIRQINEIKKLMSMDFTIEEIQNHFAMVDGELEALKVLIDQVIRKLEKSLTASNGGLVSTSVARQLVEATDTARELIRQLEKAAVQIREHACVSRDAI
jgi:DNA-binding transcriptional MerR regulator